MSSSIRYLDTAYGANSDAKLGNLYGAARIPCLKAQFCELNPFRSGKKIPWEGGIYGYMLKKCLPLDLKCVVEFLIVGDFLPIIFKFPRIRDIRIPHGLGRIHPVLNFATPQARHRASLGSVHM